MMHGAIMLMYINKEKYIIVIMLLNHNRDDNLDMSLIMTLI